MKTKQQPVFGRMMKRTMKGQADLLFILAFALVFGILSFIGLVLLGAIHTNAPMLFNATTNPQGPSIYTSGQAAVNTMDSLLIFIFIGMVLASAISAFFSEAHAVFSFIGLFILLVLLVLTAVFHNVYFNIIQASAFIGTSPSQDTFLFFEYLPEMGLGAWFVIMFATYGKGSGTANGTQQRAYG